jgi:hypothetical protein
MSLHNDSMQYLCLGTNRSRLVSKPTLILFKLPVFQPLSSRTHYSSFSHNCHQLHILHTRIITRSSITTAMKTSSMFSLALPRPSLKPYVAPSARKPRLVLIPQTPSFKTGRGVEKMAATVSKVFDKLKPSRSRRGSSRHVSSSEPTVTECEHIAEDRVEELSTSNDCKKTPLLC